MRSESLVKVEAISDDGQWLATHMSSNDEWAKYDIGIGADSNGQSKRKHDIYNAHFPDGWELEWIEQPVTHSGLHDALTKYKATRLSIKEQE